MATVMRASPLERMENELKCAICLSLFRNAASLSCNHVFCMACITTSMKTTSSCPVCKVPTTRREVRPAPQMDNLVSIYQSLETRAQPDSPTLEGNADPSRYENSKALVIYSSQPETKLRPTTPQRKKNSKRSVKRIPSKRRIQAPRVGTKRANAAAERKVKRVKPSTADPNSLDEDMEAVPGLNDIPDFSPGKPSPRSWEIKACKNSDSGGEKAGLAPFFWIKDSQEPDSELDKLTQDDQDPPEPVSVPAFSDLKDSDDVAQAEDDMGEVAKDDAFFWMQHPSSPETCCSQEKILIVEDSLDGFPEQYNMPVCGEDVKKCTSQEEEESSPSTSATLGAENLEEKVPSTSYAEKVSCAFCQGSGDSSIAGRMMFYKDDRLLHEPVPDSTAVHQSCAEWAPDAYFTESEEVRNLSSEISRAQKLKCTICRLKGAALGCCLQRCRKTFHYPCAKSQPKCKWDLDKFVVFCPEHAGCKARSKKKTVVAKAKKSPRSPEAEEIKLSPKEEQIPKAEQTKWSPKAEQTKWSPKAEKTKWSPGPSCNWVLCGSALDAHRKEELTRFAYIVGATVTTSWNQNVTHVITSTDGGAARRTIKYLMAVVEGKWILQFDWITACLSAGHALNEEPFEISSDIHGVSGGPERGRSLAASTAAKLFTGLSFYLTAHFQGSLKSDLQTLVQAGGGTVLHRKPVSGIPGSVIIVFYDDALAPDLERTKKEAQDIAESTGTVALGHSWILDSAAGCRLQSMLEYWTTGL